jgi:hypothetical protein
MSKIFEHDDGRNAEECVLFLGGGGGGEWETVMMVLVGGRT